MLQTFAILLTFQSVGELLSYALHLPVPGPVIGMMLLFLTLLADRGGILEVMQGTVTELLRHLSILFVPAGVGVMAQMHRISRSGCRSWRRWPSARGWPSVCARWSRGR